MVIKFKIRIIVNTKQNKKIVFRNKRNLCAEELLRKIINELNRRASEDCEHGLSNKRSCLDCFVSIFNSISEQIYNNECPLIEKEIMVKDNAPWYDFEVLTAKREKRKKSVNGEGLKMKSRKTSINPLKIH